MSDPISPPPQSSAGGTPFNRSSPSPSEAWRAGSLILIALSLGLHVAALVRAEPLRSANDRSRWATVRALTERGDFRIDPYEFQPGWSTIDQVQVNGNLYSTKPAPLPIVAAAISLPVEAVTGWKLAENPAPHTRWVLLFLNLVPFAAALWAVRSLLTDVARTDLARFLALGTLGFATAVSAFLPVFNNHTIGACCCALAAVPLIRIWRGARDGWRFAAAGLFAALTVCNELPAGLFGLAAFAVCLRADWKRTFAWFAPAAAVPLLLFVAATVWQTGSVKPFYMTYGTETYEFVRNGRPSYWMNPTGLDAARDGFWMYLFHCTFGHHGLFSLTPVWLLAVWSWARSLAALFKRAAHGAAHEQHPLAAFAAATGLLSVAILAFYLTRTENYNYGGRSVALRWMIWLAPLWALSLAPLADALDRRRWFAPLAACLLALSVTSAWLDSPDPWQNPWLMRELESRGWVDYALAEPNGAAADDDGRGGQFAFLRADRGLP
ncbi:hypothetical protein [Alienimonas californiensis]|uniref:Glycosyltransferase RgtA/B/C/D-like domain-containing protein n=1 Tax=Alienimonas californiensis TaxID=2527989 RepID=A0A517PAX8_9PLAN|nr:hypothetical protein [Alienimonas californiensis]QDT16511.1 hypothetical protein CA12_26160 [Alienimonas californiensis]